MFEEFNDTRSGKVIDPKNSAPVEFVITSRNDILAQDHTTRISPIRAKKENPKEESYSLTEITAGVRRLGEVYNISAINSLDGNLGSEVAKFMAQGREITEDLLKDNCPFCYKNIFVSTRDPKIFHNLNIDATGFPAFGVDGSVKKVISFPNKTPNGIIDYVTVFSEHKTTPLEISELDMENFMHSGFDIAKFYSKQAGINGIIEIINMDKSAGASQKHLHARRTGLEVQEIAYQDIEANNLRTKLSERGMTIDAYLDNVIDPTSQAHERYIFHNDYIVIFTPRAPTYTHQILAFVRPPRRNILELSFDERKYIGRSMLGVLHFLQKEFGVIGLNMETYQSRLGSDDPYMRMHFKISPRNINGIEAGLEHHGLYTVTEYPEVTATIGRKHYNTK